MATSGGGQVAAKATAELAENLAGFHRDSAIAAQARAGDMFAEFLADASPAIVKARHPWSWFVTRFQGLLVPAKKPKPQETGIDSPLKEF